MLNCLDRMKLIRTADDFGIDTTYCIFDGIAGMLEAVIHELAHVSALSPARRWRLLKRRNVTPAIGDHIISLITTRKRDWQEVVALAVEFEWYRGSDLDESHVLRDAASKMPSYNWSSDRVREVVARCRTSETTVQRVQWVNEAIRKIVDAKQGPS